MLSMMLNLVALAIDFALAIIACVDSNDSAGGAEGESATSDEPETKDLADGKGEAEEEKEKEKEEEEEERLRRRRSADPDQAGEAGSGFGGWWARLTGAGRLG